MISEVSREDTTHRKVIYLAQLQLGAQPGSRAWVRQSLRLRVAETTRDRAAVAQIVRHSHYLARWPVKPRTLILSYLADLGQGSDSPAAVAMVACLAAQIHAAKALDVHPCSVLTLCRNWRADDLGPETAPDLMPQVLRRLVKGCKRSGLLSLAQEWTARKCRPDGLYAVPRLLISYADPGVGHDGGLYRGAGASFCGPGSGGRLLFAWALDPALEGPLRQLAQAAAERAGR